MEADTGESDDRAARIEDRFRVRMRRMREDHQWSQCELALRLADYGVRLEASAIAKIEATRKGARTVRLDEAAAAAAALGSPVDEMIRPRSRQMLEGLD